MVRALRILLVVALVGTRDTHIQYQERQQRNSDEVSAHQQDSQVARCIRGAGATRAVTIVMLQGSFELSVRNDHINAHLISSTFARLISPFERPFR